MNQSDDLITESVKRTELSDTVAKNHDSEIETSKNPVKKTTAFPLTGGQR